MVLQAASCLLHAVIDQQARFSVYTNNLTNSTQCLCSGPVWQVRRAHAVAPVAAYLQEHAAMTPGRTTAITNRAMHVPLCLECCVCVGGYCRNNSSALTGAAQQQCSPQHTTNKHLQGKKVTKRFAKCQVADKLLQASDKENHALQDDLGELATWRTIRSLMKLPGKGLLCLWSLLSCCSDHLPRESVRGVILSILWYFSVRHVDIAFGTRSPAPLLTNVPCSFSFFFLFFPHSPADSTRLMTKKATTPVTSQGVIIMGHPLPCWLSSVTQHVKCLSSNFPIFPRPAQAFGSRLFARVDQCRCPTLPECRANHSLGTSRRTASRLSNERGVLVHCLVVFHQVMTASRDMSPLSRPAPSMVLTAQQAAHLPGLFYF